VLDGDDFYKWADAEDVTVVGRERPDDHGD